MDAFRRIAGQLHCEELPLSRLAEAVGTPAYVYSRGALAARCRALTSAFASHPTMACFAVKANSNLSVLREIFSHGLGADLVSIGELERALAAGAAPGKIVFSGVGKRDDEIARGLEAGIFTFNIESAYELEQVARVAAVRGVVAPVSLRVNPNIDAKTNEKIATGLYTTKFGLPEDDIDALVARVRALPSLRLVGLACHIGSQIVELGPMREAARRMCDLSLRLVRAGVPLACVDLGGGLGIQYDDETPPSFEAYAQELLAAVKPTGLPLVIEPGRVIVGNAGILLTRVIGVKRTPAKHFVVVDAAMNDLVRPTLYDAYHAIEPVLAPPSDAPEVLCDFVGPICETGDYLAKDRHAALPQPGDLLAIRSCGAYGSSMASRYNSRPMAPELLVDGARFRVVRPREALAALWEPELAALQINEGCG